MVPTLEALAKSELANIRSGPAGTGRRPGGARARYLPDTPKWLHIDTINHPPTMPPWFAQEKVAAVAAGPGSPGKSWTFMGGGAAPGLGPLIACTVEFDGAVHFPDEFAPDTKAKIGRKSLGVSERHVLPGFKGSGA